MKHLGASEAPAVVLPDGEYYYGIGDLYRRKVGDIPPNGSNGEALDAGSRFESAVLEWAKDELGVGGGASNQFRVGKDGILSATMDYLTGDNTPVEIKTTGLFSKPPNWDQWGEGGTDMVPPNVLVQVHQQMYVCGADRAIVAAWVGHRGFQHYQVSWNKSLGEMIVAAGLRFWNDHVVPRVPPATPPSTDVMMRIKRLDTGEAPIPLDDDLVERYMSAREARLAYEKAEQSEKRALLHAMGEATHGVGGGRLIRIQRIKAVRKPSPGGPYEYAKLLVKKATGQNGGAQ